MLILLVFLATISVIFPVIKMECLDLCQPHFCRFQISGDHRLSKMWKHCQTKVGRRVLITFYGIISVVASSRPYQLLCEFVRMNLTVLSLMVGICRVRRHSLICKHVGTKPQSSRGQTKDLVNSEGRKSVKQGDDESTGKTE